MCVKLDLENPLEERAIVDMRALQSLLTSLSIRCPTCGQSVSSIVDRVYLAATVTLSCSCDKAARIKLESTNYRKGNRSVLNDTFRVMLRCFAPEEGAVTRVLKKFGLQVPKADAKVDKAVASAVGTFFQESLQQKRAAYKSRSRATRSGALDAQYQRTQRATGDAHFSVSTWQDSVTADILWQEVTRKTVDTEVS